MPAHVQSADAHLDESHCVVVIRDAERDATDASRRMRDSPQGKALHELPVYDRSGAAFGAACGQVLLSNTGIPAEAFRPHALRVILDASRAQVLPAMVTRYALLRIAAALFLIGHTLRDIVDAVNAQRLHEKLVEMAKVRAFPSSGGQ